MEDQKAYIKGFNEGYLLAQHEPKLLDKLLSGIESSNEYLDGLSQGKKQLDREKLLDQAKSKKINRDRER